MGKKNITHVYNILFNNQLYILQIKVCYLSSLSNNCMLLKQKVHFLYKHKYE